MIGAAHASRYHWSKAASGVNRARGDWQCSRVYAILGRGEPALWHARRCLELVEAAPDAEDWDLPFADYLLAYRYGWRAHERHPARTFEDAEPELQAGWEQRQEQPGWDRARSVVRDAWERKAARPLMSAEPLAEWAPGFPPAFTAARPG